MASTIKVSMADLKVAKAPDSLTTLGAWFMHRAHPL